ncbi:uncharacterized protein KD926_003214 [Aspergillus affinis]|uniref:uncharacterized protein n=1 Tax=Aspergillus affinis TaxID=1070780 RepID=UPI0022FF2068|nr:uncharacterized protein KD926_003214 [Aspergillus affinis]KAI9035610.1 hypothetical protein KD926_003214 [Aspergillus affinis]
MAATMGLGLLPMIKCSNCGIDVEISAMGDHVCAKSEPVAPPPSSKSDYDALPRNTGRTGPPAPINPSVANRPFLRPENAIGVNEPAGLSPQPSPLRLVQQSQTAVPIQPHTSEIVTVGSDDLPRFPLPRSMSDKESGAMTPLADSNPIPPIPSHSYTNSNSRPPATAPLPIDLSGDAPPPPLPKDEPSSLPRISHKYGSSIDSKSSYRTSFASSRYGDGSSKRSTAMSGRRPSFGSVNQPYKYMQDDAPPVPSLHHTSYSVSDYNMSRESRNDRQEDGGSFTLGGWHQTNLQTGNQQLNSGPLRVSSHTDSDRLSSNRGSAELFFRSPSQTSFERLPDPPEYPERSTSINPPTEYKPFKSPTTGTYLHPSTPDVDSQGYGDAQRKPSDATSEGALSVSNFARSLGLDMPEQAPENSTVSSESSPSDLRSGTSFSSVASEAGTRRKPSEEARLGPVIEEPRIDTRQQYGLHTGDQTESPIDLEPPHLRDPLFSPDSPTDPAILYGSVSLLPDKTHKALPELPSKMRSATGPMSHTQNKQSQDKNLPELPRSATAPLSHTANKQSQDKNLPVVPALAPPISAFEDEPSRGTRFFPDLDAPIPSPSHIPKKPSWTERLSPERLRSKPSISHISKKQSREENIVPDFRRPSPEPHHVPQRPSRENVPDLRQPSPEPSFAKELVQEKPYPNIPGFSVEQPFHISRKSSTDETSTPPSAFHFPLKPSQDEKLPSISTSFPEPYHVQNKLSGENKLTPVVSGFLPEAPFHIAKKPSWIDRFTPEVTRSPTPPISHSAKSSQDEHSPPQRSKSPAPPIHLQNKASQDDKYLPELPKSPAEPSHAFNKLSQDDKYLPELPQPTSEPPFHISNKPSQSNRLSPELVRSPPPASHIASKPSQDDKYLPELPQPTPEPFIPHVPSKPPQSDRLSPELARSPPPSHFNKLSQDDKSLPRLPEPSPLFKPSWDGRRSPEPPKSKTSEPSHFPQKPIRDPRLSPEPPRSAPPPSHIRQPSRNERAFPEPRSAEPRFAQEGSHLHNQPSHDEKTSPELLNASIDPAARLSPRPKGPCRGCGEVILGKSVSSADGRLTGRYHKECFVCYQCRIPFRTADFYVLRDLPFCAQHYHERNGSLCQGCLTGIEGQFLETNERQGRGPGDRRRYHPQCLTCRTCNVLLNGEYFEWNGQVYCERDARRAAASTPPPRMRRPTMNSSPLAAHSRGPSRGYPPPPGYPGRGRGGPRPPVPRMPDTLPDVEIPGMPGPAFLDGRYGPPPTTRRFPERRTTKLMML